MANSFAALFNAWLAREGITRSQAIARLGTASQVPYDYADGKRLPQRRFLPDLARRMGMDEAELTAAVEADRAARRAADPAAVAAAPTSEGACVPPAGGAGPGW